MVSWRMVAALSALVLAGCGTVHAATGQYAPSAQNAASTVVPSQAAARMRCPSPERQPKGVRVTTGFVAVAAIRCIRTGRMVPGRGLWQFQLRQVARHGLARLVTELRRPSARGPANVICALPEIAVQPFVLLGRDGQMISPQLPAGKCGNPQSQVLAAVRGLHWVTVSARRGSQLETEAGVISGCPAAWKDVIGVLSRFAGGKPLRPSAGGPVFPARPSFLRICVYRSQSGPAGTSLVGGDRVSGGTETALLQGIAAGRASATCARPHSMFAIVLPPRTGSPPAYVEIGGCHRVLRPDNRIGQAGAAALAIISKARRG